MIRICLQSMILKEGNLKKRHFSYSVSRCQGWSANCRSCPQSQTSLRNTPALHQTPGLLMKTVQTRNLGPGNTVARTFISTSKTVTRVGQVWDSRLWEHLIFSSTSMFPGTFPSWRRSWRTDATASEVNPAVQRPHQRKLFSRRVLMWR